MQLVFDFPVNPKFDFANFVVCSGNNTAFQFARQLTDRSGTENLLYLYGPAGSGKTHLLMAIGTTLCGRAGLPAIPCISCKDIDEIYGGFYPAEEVSRLAERLRDAPALLVDDIHLIPDHASVRVELWQLFNDFFQAGRPIAITGLFLPKELPNIDDHLASRLLWGLVAKLDISDDDSRRMIMKKLAEDRQIILPAAVIDYLLVHTRRDIPSLLEALEALHRQALVAKRKITLRLAREALALADGPR
jgi:chromosomal replication initiator protein